MRINDFFTDQQTVALIKAAEKNNLSKLKQLVQEGADPNAFGKDGMTPLLWLLGHKDKKAMKALLAVGANPNLKLQGKESPMSLAAGAKDPEFIEILLEEGGDPNAKNRFDKPALFVAIGQRRIDIVKALLNHGADINGVDNTKKTPVMYAANLNQYKIVYYLLNQGADHEHLTRGGVSLAQIVQDSTVDPEFAAYEIRQKVIAILKERGVKFPAPHPAGMEPPIQ
jgi:ankyrin repeat protein